MGKKRVYFVTGIDTDAGKSYATGVLAALWQNEGQKVITQKFVQTGCGEDCSQISEDIMVHRRIMGSDLLPEDADFTTCPVRLSYPASADLASRLDGTEIDLREIDSSTEKLLKVYDTVLIEGAGGLMVPIKGLYTTIDYISERSLPVILVTNPRLGSVNHTLLSLEACITRGIAVDYILYNHYPVTSDIITDDTRCIIQQFIAERLPECELLEVPFIEL